MTTSGTPEPSGQKPTPPVDRLDEQIRAGGERLDRLRQDADVAMHDDLQRSITKMSTEVKEEIAGVSKQVDDMANAVTRVEKKLNTEKK